MKSFVSELQQISKWAVF